MRILHVNKFVYRRGGAEAYMLDLARAQSARGDQVEFFGMDHADNEPSRFAPWFPDEVDFRSTDLAERAAAVGRMLWSSTARRGMEEVLRLHRPDVAHLHNVYHHLSPSILRAIARAGVPIVLTLHDYKLVCPSYQLLDHGRHCEACIGGSLLEPVRRRCKDGSLASSVAVAVETALHRALRAYDPVDVLVSPSAYLAGRMAAGGIDPDRIQICRLFTDAVAASPPPTEGLGSRRVAFVGRLEHEKGLDVLIRAMAELPDLRLSVAGEGSEGEALQALADRLAPSRIDFLGRLDKAAVRSIMSGVQAVAVPSRWAENQPLTVLDALALGAPVVASAIGGIPEMITDGATGLLVPPDDWASLATALGRLDHDRSLATALSVAAREESASYGLERHLDRLDELYELADRRRRSGQPRRRLIDPPSRPMRGPPLDSEPGHGDIGV